jgi:hypothetical protein
VGLCTPLGHLVGLVRDLGHGKDAVGEGEESDSGELHVDELGWSFNRRALSVVSIVRIGVPSEVVG